MSQIVIGQYIPGDSIIHRFDPRAKLLFVFFFFCFIFLVNNFTCYALLYAFVAVSIASSRIRFRLFVSAIKPVLFVIALTVILHLTMTKGGGVLWSTPWFTIEAMGVHQALLLASRFLLLVIVAALLTFTTPSLDLTDALERLLAPLQRIRIPVHELALMMSIALRFIPTLWAEMDKIKSAQLARGANLESGHLIKRLAAYVPIFIPLLLSVFRRAEELALAMEARGYRGSAGRSKYRQLQYHRRDIILLLICIGLMLGIGGLRT